MDQLGVDRDDRRSNRAQAARHANLRSAENGVDDQVFTGSSNDAGGLEHRVRQNVLSRNNVQHGVSRRSLSGKLKFREDHTLHPEAMLDLLGSLRREQRSKSEQGSHAIGHELGDVQAERLLSEVRRIVVGSKDASSHDSVLEKLQVASADAVNNNGGSKRC